ncbi:MAG TPA: hypothetical protein DHV05_08015 [Acholeplasmataceae bacterium]|nr:hypothetical protein [Acholeplasmataceae bacterium]
MISKENKNKLQILVIVTGIILVFDLFTIVSNIYVSPILDGYGLPDILIYLKTIVFLALFIISIIWVNNEDIKLPKSIMKILLYVGLAIIFGYFLSLFMYKYVLLLETTDIIKNKILNGNPALVFDFSGINYRTLTYLTTIFSGFNSEIILFSEALIMQAVLYKLDRVQIIDEPTHVYDAFLFDSKVFPLFFGLAITSFTSLNLFLYRFDVLGSIEMAVALLGFAAVISGIIPAYKIFKTKNNECTQSFFIGTYKFMFIIAAFSSIMYLALFGLNLAFYSLDRGTYRIIPALLSLLVSIILFIRIHNILKLENK